MATAESHLNQMQKPAGGIQSVAQLFRRRIAEDGARTAARRKVQGAWQDVSWTQLGAESEEAAWGLVALGIKNGGMVSLLAGTRVEWTVADMGIAQAGGVAVPVYQSNTPEECQFIFENSGA